MFLWYRRQNLAYFSLSVVFVCWFIGFVDRFASFLVVALSWYRVGFEHHEVRRLQADACVKDESWLRGRLEGLVKSDMQTIAVKLKKTSRDASGKVWLLVPTLVENVVAHFHPRTVACLRC